jgi:hypothetical protein
MIRLEFSLSGREIRTAQPVISSALRRRELYGGFYDHYLSTAFNGDGPYRLRNVNVARTASPFVKVKCQHEG